MYENTDVFLSYTHTLTHTQLHTCAFTKLICRNTLEVYETKRVQLILFKVTSLTELCPPEQQPALPTTSPSHQEACTSLLDSLIHQRADSRSKKNYNTAVCGTKTPFKERETK